MSSTKRRSTSAWTTGERPEKIAKRLVPRGGAGARELELVRGEKSIITNLKVLESPVSERDEQRFG